VEFHGETLELPLPDGPGKALKLTIAPVQSSIPIYVAAIGPKNTALTAEIVPTVSVNVSDDLEAARDSMRGYVALYVGGMGSRKQNFYNALVRRYGFEDAAARVQSLYLEGRKEEAAAALPPELLDTVALVGPRDHVRERLAVYRDAGVGTLMISPMAWTF